jgi:hypothetical protein
MKTNVNEHTISSHWCPRCKESKEETITDDPPAIYL